MMLISFSVALLALAAGAFLLAETMKDNLNIFFKVVSYFIIVASILSMACIGIHGAVRMYSARQHQPGEMRMGEMRMMGGDRWGGGEGRHFHEGGMRGEHFHDGMRGGYFHGDMRNDSTHHDGAMHEGPHADGRGRGKDGGWGWKRGNHEMRDSTQRRN